MRYSTQTHLSPREVIDRACAFFGPDSQLGLPEASTQDNAITFCDQTGFVSVSCTPSDGGTSVIVLSREYDSWAERFIRNLG